MRIQKQTKRKNRILIILLSLLVILGAIFAYFYFTITTSDSKNESTPPDTFKSDRDQSKDLQHDPDNKDKAPNTDHPATPSTVTDSNKKQVQVVASTNRSSDTIFIRGGINYPVSGGSCYAELSGPSGQSIRKDSTVLQNPASTDCKTISIPLTELAPGNWTFLLHYTSDSYEGVSDEISFVI